MSNTIRKFFSVSVIQISKIEEDRNIDTIQPYPTNQFFDSWDDAFKYATYENDINRPGCTIKFTELSSKIDFLIDKFQNADKPFTNVPGGRYKVEISTDYGKYNYIAYSLITFNGIKK